MNSSMILHNFLFFFHKECVQITQENVMSVVNIIRDSFVLARQLLGRTIVNTSVAPWFHSMGFFGLIINNCSRDTTFLFLPKYDNESFLRCIEEYKISSVSVVPPIMVFLAKSHMVDKYDLSSLISMIREL